MTYDGIFIIYTLNMDKVTYLCKMYIIINSTKKDILNYSDKFLFSFSFLFFPLERERFEF